jgi:cyclic pyranopterin phosphate synthase
MSQRPAGLTIYQERQPSSSRLPPRSVRLSLTDRCDLACVYCRPSRSDGYLAHRLEDEAWKSMVAGLVQAGVRRVRLTGGEPLLHPRVVGLVRWVSSLGVDDLALTTNGTRLAPIASSLRAAGLRRITISLDSLDAARFERITRGGKLREVIAGIEAAVEAGFDEVKINCVVLRDENDDELPSLARWAWARGITPRFIELMPIAEGAKIVAEKLVTAAEMRVRLGDLIEDGAGQVDVDRGPARYVRARHDPSLRIGFITGTSDTFCDSCDRLRVAADGTLRSCLASNVGTDARVFAESGDIGGIVRATDDAWRQKPDGRSWRGCTEESATHVSMRAIGG